MTSRKYFIKIGAYTDSAGIEIIRKHAARYIERRDGIPSDYQDIILSAGASNGIKVYTNPPPPPSLRKISQLTLK